MLALNNTRINNYQYFSRMIFYNSINFTPPNPSSSLIKNQNFRCFWFPRCREETGEEISLLWTSHSTVSREKYSKRGELNVWRCQTGTISDASCSISAPLETTYVRIWSIKNSSGERKEKKKEKEGEKGNERGKRKRKNSQWPSIWRRGPFSTSGHHGRTGTVDAKRTQIENTQNNRYMEKPCQRSAPDEAPELAAV